MNTDPGAERAVSPIRCFGGFRLDLRRRMLLGPTGAPIALTQRVLDTLICMVQSPGVLLSRDTLMDSVWPDTAVEPNNLSQTVAKLRRLFGERPGENRFIETVPGRGYRFIADVHADSATGDAARGSGDPTLLDAEARQLYRQGLRLLQRPTAENCRSAVEALEAALVREPGSALARAWLADAHLLSVNAGHAGGEALEAADRHAHRALELAPATAVAHAVLATVQALRQDWLAAESHFMTAISIDEGDAMARTLHATFLLQQVGHTRRALAQIRAAFSLLPDDPRMLMNLAMSSSIAGHDEEALRCARLAVAFGYPERAYPLSLVFMQAAERAERYDEAAFHASSLLDAEHWRTHVVRRVHGALENPCSAPEAIAALHELLDSSLDAVLRAREALLLIVRWLTQLGRVDLAFDALDRALVACARGTARMPHWQTLWTPELRPFRADERFGALTVRLSFTRYWSVFGSPDR